MNKPTKTRKCYGRFLQFSNIYNIECRNKRNFPLYIYRVLIIVWKINVRL